MENTVKKIKLSGIIALFFVNFAYMADYVIVPAVNSIYEAFPDASAWALNFVTTGSQLMALISALLSSVLMRYFSKKRIIIFFFALFSVATIFGCTVENIYYIAFMRGLAGFSFGALPATALALINEVYHDDEKKCNWLVGSFNSFMALLGAIMTLVAGILCGIRWDMVFYEYWAAIPLLLMMIFCIPYTPPEKENMTTGYSKELAVKFNILPLVRLLLSLSLFGILYIFISYQCSIYISENNIGGSELAGIASSIMIGGSVLGGLLFAPLYEKLERKTIALLFFGLAVAFLGISFVWGAIWFCVCCVVFGFTYGMALPFYYQYIIKITPKRLRSQALGFVTAAIGLGAFLSVYIVSFVMNILNFTLQIQIMPYLCGTALVLGLIALKNDKKING